LLKRVASLCAGRIGVPVQTVLGRRRGPLPVVLARQLALYLVHVEARLPLRCLGTLTGLHRSTIAHACRAIEDRRDDVRFDRLVQDLAAAMPKSIRPATRS
jgi:chromosomal replication initiation ATPase DnaA